jgi:hypothetical protein
MKATESARTNLRVDFESVRKGDIQKKTKREQRGKSLFLWQQLFVLESFPPPSPIKNTRIVIVSALVQNRAWGGGGIIFLQPFPFHTVRKKEKNWVQSYRGRFFLL